jgi:hypothetical protein
MKQIKHLSVSLLILFSSISFLAGGCKKSNNNSPNPNQNPLSQGSLSANVGGTSWQAGSVYAVDSTNMIAIVAATSNTGSNAFPFLLMIFPDNTPEGSTVNFNVAQSSMLQYYENQNTVYYAEPSFGGSGSVTITKFNRSTKRIEGNFTGTLKSAAPGGPSKTVTGGQFAINYR